MSWHGFGGLACHLGDARRTFGEGPAAQGTSLRIVMTRANAHRQECCDPACLVMHQVLALCEAPPALEQGECVSQLDRKSVV